MKARDTAQFAKHMRESCCRCSWFRLSRIATGVKIGYGAVAVTKDLGLDAGWFQGKRRTAANRMLIV